MEQGKVSRLKVRNAGNFSHLSLGWVQFSNRPSQPVKASLYTTFFYYVLLMKYVCVCIYIYITPIIYLGICIYLKSLGLIHQEKKNFLFGRLNTGPQIGS